MGTIFDGPTPKGIDVSKNRYRTLWLGSCEQAGSGREGKKTGRRGGAQANAGNA